MQGVHLRKYGVQTTINFELYEIDGVDFRVDAAHAAGDSVIMKDEGAEANTTNGFTDEGTGYSIVLTATEMQAARIVLYFVDQTATKVWLDKAIVIETYGNASAMHAFDLGTAMASQTVGTASALTTNNDKTGYALSAAGNAAITDDWETQSQADPTGFHVNVKEVNGTAQTANDNGADINAILDDTGTNGVLLAATATSPQLVDDVWDEAITGAIHNGATSAGKRLRQASDSTLILHEGTAQGAGGGTDTIQLAAGASASNNAYHDAFVTIVGGTGAGQVKFIIAYVGATKICTMNGDWDVTPDNTSEYVISGNAASDLYAIDDDLQSVIDLKDMVDTAYDPANNRIDTNLKAINGTAQDAIDLGDLASDGYDPATDKLKGVETVDVTTSVTGTVTINPAVLVSL